MATRGPDPTVTDNQLTDAIRETGYPGGTASDVAEIVGLSRQRARQRLERLCENDELYRAKLNSGVVLYWCDETTG